MDATQVTAHTPGPWQWVFRDRVATLVHPHRGWLTVMDFVRLGMQGGTFRLATWKGDKRENMGGIMRPAHEIDVAAHPDARLIAAAPDLAAEHADAIGFLEGYAESLTHDGFTRHAERVDALVARMKATRTKIAAPEPRL